RPATVGVRAGGPKLPSLRHAHQARRQRRAGCVLVPGLPTLNAQGMSSRLTMTPTRVDLTARFKSPGVACDDRNVSSFACCQDYSRFCLADRMRKDDHPRALAQTCAIN